MKSDETARESEALHRQAEKMEAVGMLARGIAHDFNNILSGILGFTSYLKSKAPEGSDLHRDLGLVEQAGIQAAELTQKLFLIARRRPGAHEPVFLNKVMAAALSEFRGQWPPKVVVETDVPSRVPPMAGDESKLEILVRNLLRRALAVMPEEGGKIRVELESRPLTRHEEDVLVNTESRDYLCMAISDSGRGMSAEACARIFDPFYLARTSREGPGLDMPIVYGIVANHMGSIRVESEEGRGTTFRVYLPVQEAKDGEALAEDQQLGGDETVLVVDDESMIREMIVWVLESKGYHVLSASSGEEAVRICGEQGEKVDLVLLDIVMPGMGGEDAFHALRAAHPALRVLLTSIRAHEALCERLIGQGARGMVVKPYKSNVLLSAVRKALGPPPKR